MGSTLSVRSFARHGTCMSVEGAMRVGRTM
jgi:hypothetical protein